MDLSSILPDRVPGKIFKKVADWQVYGLIQTATTQKSLAMIDTTMPEKLWDRIRAMFIQTKNKHAKADHQPTNTDLSYDVPDNYANLSEVAVPPPIENMDENAHTYTHHTLEEAWEDKR